MKIKFHILATLLALGGATLCNGHTSPLRLVKDGRSRAYILLSQDPSEQAVFAADQLNEYLRKMTGAELSIFRMGQKGQPDSMPAVLIGSVQSHPAIAQLIADKKITINITELGDEGFLLKTVAWNGRRSFVVAGMSEVATVYAVYDVLERFGRVGFFRHEEHVPKRSDFAIPACDIREKPYFKTRMHGGQYHYFGIQFYSEAQWQDEMRWFAKNRLNRINYIPGPPLGEQAMANVWRRIGVEPKGVSSSSQSNLEMSQRLSKYGLTLGVHAPYATSDGSLPPSVAESFKERYPNVQYLKMEKGGSFIHPDDPMWLKLNQAYLRGFAEQFGEGKVFGLPTPYPETSPGETFEEQEAIVNSFANAVGRLATWAESEYPGAEWTWDAWVFANKAYWQPRRVKRLFEALPPELNMIVWDYPAEDEPTYELQNYWHGRPWAFIVFHSSAGNTAVHGDVNGLMGNVFRVLADLRTTKNFDGFGHYTEARDYVPFYKDLVQRMSWNPFLNIDDFTTDYCERRYKPESVAKMVACYQNLIKTVYGPQSDTHMTHGFRTVRLQDPVYWFQLGANWVPFDDLQHRMLVGRKHWGPKLQQALVDAFSVYEDEKDNPAYVRDLVDIMRSYVHVKINQAIWDTFAAARRGDRDSFDKHHAHVQRLFDYQLKAINLVAHRWEFGVNALIEDFKDNPVSRTPSEIRHHLYYVTFSGDGFHDYFRTDRYEMIRDIYRPLTMAALDGLREKLDEKKGGATLEPVITKGYASLMDAVREEAHVAASSQQRAIVDKFIEGPCDAPPAAPDAADVVSEFLAAIDRGDL